MSMSTTNAHIDERDGAITIIKTLRNAGHTAYLAGGCVRDLLLGETPKDYDVATSAHPEDIAKLFKKTAAVGAAFGVMLVRDFGPTIEVATFRSDGPYSDTRRPDHVEFSSPEMDAQRRDFTINALFLDPNDDGDEIIDFVQGKADVERRILRAVGDPHQRLKEDHLRALRAVRFAARYDLEIDPITSEAIKQHASELSGVSVERIGEEVRRMMAHSSRARAAGLLQQLTLDRAIFGSESKSDQLPILMELDPDADSTTALAAWAIDRLNDTSAHDWRKRLDLSNDETQKLSATIEIAGVLLNQWNELSTPAKKRLSCRDHCCGAIMLARAINAKLTEMICNDIQMMESDGIGLNPEPMINGQVLIEMGHQPGARFKEVLDLVYDAQLEGKVNSTDSARNLASELFVKYNKSDQ
jgi:tRNA nucleotidyltransferase/poly(A) polymerase